MPPVASLYLVARRSNSAACWEACFLRVSAGERNEIRSKERWPESRTKIPLLGFWCCKLFLQLCYLLLVVVFLCTGFARRLIEVEPLDDGHCWFKHTDLFLKLGVLLLSLDKVKKNVERPSEDEGEKEGKSCEIGISLGATGVPWAGISER